MLCVAQNSSSAAMLCFGDVRSTFGIRQSRTGRSAINRDSSRSVKPCHLRSVSLRNALLSAAIIRGVANKRSQP